MNNKDKKVTGTLKISEDAIIRIAESAAAEIKGVALSATNKLAVLSPKAGVGESFITPISIKLHSDYVSIDISIIVSATAKASEVAKSVQNNVKSAVQSMTGITVSKVNVTVAGIHAE